MKIKTHSIKSIILSIALVGESYYMSSIFLSYVSSGEFFNPPKEFFIQTILILLLILYTYFLTIGGWGKWEQYLTVALPIALGIALKILILDPTYALLMFLIIFSLLSYDMLITTRLKDQMIKFNPRIILKISTRGIIFVFSITAAIFVLVYSPNNDSTFNVGQKLGSVVQQQFDNFVKPKLNNQIQMQLDNQTDLPIESNDYIPGLPAINLDLKNTIETEFNNIIEPYKQFIPPLVAIIVFTFIRFLGGISRLIFTYTAKLVYGFFKKIGFLHVKYLDVKKEEITFDKEGNNLLKT